MVELRTAAEIKCPKKLKIFTVWSLTDQVGRCLLQGALIGCVHTGWERRPGAHLLGHSATHCVALREMPNLSERLCSSEPMWAVTVDVAQGAVRAAWEAQEQGLALGGCSSRSDLPAPSQSQQGGAGPGCPWKLRVPNLDAQGPCSPGSKTDGVVFYSPRCSHSP